MNAANHLPQFWKLRLAEVPATANAMSKIFVNIFALYVLLFYKSAASTTNVMPEQLDCFKYQNFSEHLQVLKEYLRLMSYILDILIAISNR